MSDIYDLIIVGAGITGSALFYISSRYSDLKNVLLLEKYSDISTLNSSSRSNSQTLHFGDVETNYSYEKAKDVKQSAEYILNYTGIKNGRYNKHIIQKCQKMVLGVGDMESQQLENTYASKMHTLFPGLKKLRSKELERIEPNLVKGRQKDEALLALLSNNGYMVDFGALSKSFANNGKKKKDYKIKFNSKVKKISRENDNYVLETNDSVYKARFVVFASGIYSLYFAKSMGYDKNISILPVGGGYYYSKKVLNGKVYRVQQGNIPFAAIHADPDIKDPNVTRYGPTVILGPLLEKGHLDTAFDNLKIFDLDIDTLISLKNILFNRDIYRIMSKNAIYPIPIIGKYNFLKNEAQKIVPKLKYSDLWTVKNTGGIRPQIINEKTHSLILGEAKLKEEHLIFNITPSPGASSCIGSALEDIQYITSQLDRNFNYALFKKELGS